MNDILQEKYNRLIHEHPNISSIDKPLMNISDVLSAYFILADYFTDTTAEQDVTPMFAEALKMDMLYSALVRQCISSGQHTKYSEPLEICATLFFGLVMNHCFIDGNKRTALLTLLYQLELYGYMPNTKVHDFEMLTMSVAADTLAKDFPKEWRKSRHQEDVIDRKVCTIYLRLKQMVKKKDSSFHIKITAKEFISTMNKIPDCKCFVVGTKIKVEYGVQRKFLGLLSIGSNVKRYSLPFRGETRTIGAKTIREALKELGLFEQYADYHGLIEGDEPRYMLIEQFETPLRRLKDQ